MIYGLYLSATGVLANSFRQDVIANNLANAQTVGFKRSLALVQQRRTEAQQTGDTESTNALLESIGGGMLLTPAFVDHSQGTLLQTQSNLDLAINGRGYFAVKKGKETLLTRNGRFMLDREGYLTLADGSGHQVLDAEWNKIPLGNVPQSQVTIGTDGSVSVNGILITRLAMLDVPDTSQLTQRGQTLLSHPDVKKLKPATGSLQAGFIEESNVDPMIELTQLINAQRQLEANANMIRYQDQTLSKLVNEVGKIG